MLHNDSPGCNLLALDDSTIGICFGDDNTAKSLNILLLKVEKKGTKLFVLSFMCYPQLSLQSLNHQRNIQKLSWACVKLQEMEQRSQDTISLSAEY